MRSPEEARCFLEKHQSDFLSADVGIHGKVGGGEMPGQQQVMMQCDSALQAEICKETMKRWLRKHHNNPLNSYSTEQGCKHPFLELFGPISRIDRSQRMVPTRPEAIRTVLDTYLQDSTIARFDPLHVRRWKTRL